MKLSIAELRKQANELQIDISSCTSKEDVSQLITSHLYSCNNDYSSQINHYHEIIKALTSKIDTNISHIQNMCNHEFKPEISYGDRTQWICIKCHVYK